MHSFHTTPLLLELLVPQLFVLLSYCLVGFALCCTLTISFLHYIIVSSFDFLISSTLFPHAFPSILSWNNDVGLLINSTFSLMKYLPTRKNTTAYLIFIFHRLPLAVPIFRVKKCLCWGLAPESDLDDCLNSLYITYVEILVFSIPGEKITSIFMLETNFFAM